MTAGPLPRALEGETVAFAGRLSSLSRREARAAVRLLGGTPADEISSRTTIIVVGMGTEPGVQGASNPSPDSHGACSRRVRTMGEDEFCRLAGLPQPSELRSKYYAASDIIERYAPIREAHLRYLEKWRLVTPVARTWSDAYYAFPDLVLIKHVSAELQRGVPLRAVMRSLQAERSGQLSLDFQAQFRGAKVLSIAGRKRPEATPADASCLSAAERLFLEASAIDQGDESTREAAAEGYRKALALDPCLVPALINLGNLYYAADRLAEAQALYERAAAVDDEVFEAPFNLGNVHHDQGRFEEARACYLRAVSLDPAYADARFYLAVTLEKLGRSDEAKPHWRAYQQLAPTGEWIELAREFSD
ncbi:MAG: tetratricopeptide repeat protein [Vicinamibacterales bacterium]